MLDHSSMAFEWQMYYYAAQDFLFGQAMEDSLYTGVHKLIDC